MLAKLSTVRGSFCGGVAEMKPNEDTGIRILICRLGEAAERPKHWGRIVTGGTVREFCAAVLKTNLIGAKQLLEHLSPRPTFDGITGWVVLIRRSNLE